ncbi:MAG: UDP-N-acetylglucosamine 1-carboxyvinyltransferase [Planctomyces sp.]|nr:UDP-N-acetylglucosamine 1-carboxyvinyltransferase [Planctomyces sp.]
MDMFVVRGGQPLAGHVRVSGSKNAALPIMAAMLAVDGPVRLHDVPHLVDVRTLLDLLTRLGLQHSRSEADQTLELEVVDTTLCLAEYDLVRKMRASICVLGPLLARRGRACVSLPGGCNIGDRPIDLHLKGLRALGAEIQIERGYIFAEARQLRGAHIFLGGPFGSTVTGTCNLMVAGALAEGTTTIESAACEPEVVDLGNFLNQLGARIEGLGTPFLRIEGVPSLNAAGDDYRIIPDRIEAATLMMAVAMTGGDIDLENVDLRPLTAVVEKLREVGVTIRAMGNRVHVSRQGALRPTDCCTLPYPGIPTDVQAQLMALLTMAEGMSVITDKVFPDRFMHAAELVRMGARIRREGPSAIISGVSRLSGANVMASDLRASAALVIAALAGEGESAIRRIYHLDRGYEQLERKLQHLGADIRRVQDCPENIPASLRPEWSEVEDAEHTEKLQQFVIPRPHLFDRSESRVQRP